MKCVIACVIHECNARVSVRSVSWRSSFARSPCLQRCVVSGEFFLLCSQCVARLYCEGCLLIEECMLFLMSFWWVYMTVINSISSRPLYDPLFLPFKTYHLPLISPDFRLFFTRLGKDNVFTWSVLTHRHIWRIHFNERRHSNLQKRATEIPSLTEHFLLFASDMWDPSSLASWRD